MFISHLNPVILDLGPLQVRWYGVFYAIGFLMGYYFIRWLAKRRGIKALDKDGAGDLIVYLIAGMIIGARFFHVFVFNASYYLVHPAEIIAVWQGGLSFHGGLLGAIIAALIFCKKRKIDFLELADITSIPLALGLALGRIGNLINGELYGTVTNVPWAVKFPAAEGFRHPSQIYESMKNLLIFGILFSLKDKKWRKGTLFCLFLFMYGMLRFALEFFRERDHIIAGISLGQWLCAGMILAAAVIYLFLEKKRNL
ncbi:MAG: prolipoprotein diacylglyceryl transferase [Nanoarchaeota archaeon]